MKKFQVYYRLDPDSSRLLESCDTVEECREFIDINKLTDWKIIQLDYGTGKYEMPHAGELTIPEVDISLFDHSERHQ